MQTRIDLPKFSKGDYVKKNSGYDFPGIVVCVFKTQGGQVRYVIESTSVATEGLLHIFNATQLMIDREGK